MSVVAGGGRGLGRDRTFGGEHGAFALLHQPASKHGRGIFFEPLIEELGDFLAEIGSVGQARKLVGLERGARSGEKEFPGSLGMELGHEDLQSRAIKECDCDINIRVITSASNHRINRLWKAVEKQENGVGACSGCAGDYEDPDWSAWEEELEDEQRNGGNLEEDTGRDLRYET